MVMYRSMDFSEVKDVPCTWGGEDKKLDLCGPLLAKTYTFDQCAHCVSKCLQLCLIGTVLCCITYQGVHYSATGNTDGHPLEATIYGKGIAGC